MPAVPGVSVTDYEKYRLGQIGMSVESEILHEVSDAIVWIHEVYSV